jgi:hypothetical protein
LAGRVSGREVRVEGEREAGKRGGKRRSDTQMYLEGPARLSCPRIWESTRICTMLRRMAATSASKLRRHYLTRTEATFHDL